MNATHPFKEYKSDVWFWRWVSIVSICVAVLFMLLYIGERVSTPVVKVQLKSYVDGVAVYDTFNKRDRE